MSRARCLHKRVRMTRGPILVFVDAFDDEGEIHSTSSDRDNVDKQTFKLLPDGHFMQSGMRCAVCASDLNRSHVRWWEHAYAIVTTKRPFRCSRCQRRAWFDVPSPSPLEAQSGGAFIDANVSRPEAMPRHQAT